MQKLVGMSSVQFPNDKMYEAFVDGIEKLKKSQSGKEQFFILDETNHTIWIMWYEESLI